MLGGIADLTWRRPRLVLAVVAVFAVIAGAVGYDVEHDLQAAGFTDSSSESERATADLREALGYDPTPAIVALVRDPDGGRLALDDPAVRGEVGRIADRLRSVENVGDVVDPLSDPRGAKNVAPDAESLVVTAFLSAQDVEDVGGDAAVEAKAKVRSESLDVTFAGFAPTFKEVEEQTRRDLTNAELIAFPALTILLLLVFRSVVAAVVPLLIGVLSILGVFLFLSVMARVTDTSLFALNLATALSLGLAVDYALLLVSRYREEAEEHGHGREAHRRMVLGAGRGVLFSGLTVAAAMAALIVMPQRFLYSIGAAGAVVGVLAAVLALLVVPSLVAVLGPRIEALSLRRGSSVASISPGWYRLARDVMRRPGVVAAASALILLAFSAPVAVAELTGPAASAVPEGQPSYEPNEYIVDRYPRDVTEAITVAVRGDVSDVRLAALRDRIAGGDGIDSVAPFTRASRDLAFTMAAATGPALDGPAQDAVREIRGLSPPGGSDLLVTGNTARFLDQKESLVRNAVIVAVLILLGTGVLIFLLTGSVILPLKTLVMNVFTLAATLGVVLLGFQHGLLEAPFAYPGPDAVEIISLAFLFAVTFALATDYAVLVLARIKEHHENGAETEEAVALGIARTGRIITAAAAMIAVVFLAFAVSPVFFMKQIAVGAAVGVIIDTTIVRALLVPALMRLFGDWNWWAPGPLRRFHARFGLRD